RYVEILEAVVVVVASGHAHSVTKTLQAGFFGYIFKRPVLFLMIEPVPELGPGFLRNRSFRSGIGKRRTIDEKEVQTTVVVVVEKGDARAHGFRKVFFRSMLGAILKTHAKFSGNVSERSGRARVAGICVCLRCGEGRTKNPQAESRILVHGSTIPLPSTTVKILSTAGT